MNEEAKTYDSLEIRAAADSGYFVMRPFAENVGRLPDPILFCGDLGGCLEYVRKRIRQ